MNFFSCYYFDKIMRVFKVIFDSMCDRITKCVCIENLIAKNSGL